MKVLVVGDGDLEKIPFEYNGNQYELEGSARAKQGSLKTVDCHILGRALAIRFRKSLKQDITKFQLGEYLNQPFIMHPSFMYQPKKWNHEPTGKFRQTWHEHVGKHTGTIEHLYNRDLKAVNDIGEWSISLKEPHRLNVSHLTTRDNRVRLYRSKVIEYNGTVTLDIILHGNLRSIFSMGGNFTEIKDFRNGLTVPLKHVPDEEGILRIIQELDMPTADGEELQRMFWAADEEVRRSEQS